MMARIELLLTCGATFRLAKGAFASYTHTHLLWYSCIKPRALVTGLAIDGGGGDGHLLHDSSIIEFLDIE